MPSTQLHCSQRVAWLPRPGPPMMPQESPPDMNVMTACFHFSMRFTLLKLIA
jgi:hypothetical protein